ncbi:MULTISPECIES: hypothetical protein [unclassified Streptomyces]|uniref:hypothetical protein n=1 Tax=unclassified Streptomyces TaxID=2593676 RepID=UPI00331AB63B
MCEDAFDISDRYKAQRRPALLVEAGLGIGSTLDVMVIAQKITEVAVPEFTTTVMVDLANEVLEGEVGQCHHPDPRVRTPLGAMGVRHAGALPHRTEAVADRSVRPGSA